MTTHRERTLGQARAVCGWWVGPIWKLGGETCVCHLAPGHAGWHECTCGSSFEGCGHPPWERHDNAR